MQTTYLVVLHKIIGGLFLGHTTDLTDQDDALGVWILQEDLQAVDEVGSVERIASNADAQRLAQADLGRLVDGFVGQRAGPGHDSDLAALVNMARHNTDFALRKN